MSVDTEPKSWCLAGPIGYHTAVQTCILGLCVCVCVCVCVCGEHTVTVYRSSCGSYLKRHGLKSCERAADSEVQFHSGIH